MVGDGSGHIGCMLKPTKIPIRRNGMQPSLVSCNIAAIQLSKPCHHATEGYQRSFAHSAMTLKMGHRDSVKAELVLSRKECRRCGLTCGFQSLS